MSKRAEDLADKLYPFRYDSHGDVIDFKNTIILRGVCIEIYEQAEKDLALTWEDIEKITDIHRDVLFENPKRIMFSKENYEDTLIRFNKLREMLNPSQY